MRSGLKPPGAAFLDRDGTINVKALGESSYIETPQQLRLLDGAASAIRKLNDAGVRVVVLTNQRGIALGRLTHEDLASIHAHLNELLDCQGGAHVDGFFYCPHDRDVCSCRKPGVGLFMQAKKCWPEIDFDASAMVGDSDTDIAAGERMGMTSIQLGHDVPDLSSAVDLLLGGK